MMKTKVAFLATSALVGSLMLATNALAQSTATTEVETDVVTVTAQRGPANVEGVITAETEPKSRATVGQEFISTQSTGQSVLNTINLTPGVNFTNNDPYGSSGGNLRIRGFDGNRISLTFDGVPLNDTGNYAIFSNQQQDPELIERAAVNLGSTDVDSPTASATGGTVNYTTMKPTADGSFMAQPSIGSFNYRRLFAMANVGEFGPFGTVAWVAGSYQKYDKFRGVGELEKVQVNAKLYQLLNDNGDFFSVGIHYNQNRNNSYRSYSAAAFKFYGYNYDYLPTCTRPVPTTGTGTIQNDNAAAAASPSYLATGDNPAGTSSCTNYQGLRLNPSNTGNIRGQFKYHLADNIILTVDPSFQYTLANGGGSFTLAEGATSGSATAAIVRGNKTGAALVGCAANANTGIDLNGDTDACDTVRFYSPSNTNTRRYGLTSSLIWDINENNRVRIAYTLDYGRHRQTGEYTSLDNAGNPGNPFGGKDGQGAKVYNGDGYFFRSRDRFSIALLNQVAVEYRGRFMDDRLAVNIGVRAPFFERELNQFCYTNNTSTTAIPSGSAVTCTNAAVATTSAVNGTVTLVNGGSATFIKPFKATVKYDSVLPNVGVSYKLGGGHSLYASYSQGLSAPRTDQLYTARLLNPSAGVFVAAPADVQPEETKAYDIGWRYSSGTVIAAAALWYNDYQNRIVTSFDPDTGVSVDRNVGSVKLWGVDAQVGFEVTDAITLYGSASYTNSELQDNLLAGTTSVLNANPVYTAVGTKVYIPTKGKSLVETPEWTLGGRATWDATSDLHFGLQAKYVGKRFSTDVNDESAPAYTTVDLDARYDLHLFRDKTSYLQLNIINLFDESYFGSISSGTALNAIPGVITAGSVVTGSGMIATNASFYQIAPPRTIQLTFRAAF